MMTAVRILLNSYVGLYAFLELPEGQWIGLIQNRQEKEKTQPPQIPFSDMREPNFENKKTTTHLQQLTNQ